MSLALGAHSWSKRAAAIVALPVLLAACSGGGSDQDSKSAAPEKTGSGPTSSKGVQGPMFPECGGISEQTMTELTKAPGLTTTARNSAGCVWLQNGGISGPHFSFTWFRGSPIGRERATEARTRPSVDDIEIGGYKGFIAMGGYPGTVNALCEIGMDFGNDFIEWSISFAREPFPDPCDVAKQLTDMSIKAAKK